MNRILDEVMSGLKEREFEIADIQIVRDYDAGIPEILLDSDRLKQVFLNLINNAGDAIAAPAPSPFPPAVLTIKFKLWLKIRGPGYRPSTSATYSTLFSRPKR